MIRECLVLRMVFDVSKKVSYIIFFGCMYGGRLYDIRIHPILHLLKKTKHPS